MTATLNKGEIWTDSCIEGTQCAEEMNGENGHLKAKVRGLV